jgi:hypothetical protein
MTDRSACDGCGISVETPLLREVRVGVDGKDVDRQVLCPDCFARWIDRYRTEMQPRASSEDDGESLIID